MASESIAHLAFGLMGYVCLALRPLHHLLITAYTTWSAHVQCRGKKTCFAACYNIIALLTLVCLKYCKRFMCFEHFQTQLWEGILLLKTVDLHYQFKQERWLFQIFNLLKTLRHYFIMTVNEISPKKSTLAGYLNIIALGSLKLQPLRWSYLQLKFVFLQFTSSSSFNPFMG